ncbi:ABC transporter permease [Moritella yayanosii]|uniref:ABC transporter permease n=1 Tax=Moritella yayanosii TaxID=69539 RepID=A0A330LII8_9GAMM|nr:FtsX-like permease family protein [Moritella yayanosii]SQD76680.1 conserved membrane protein of unknown function, might belong to ABC-type transport system, permease component [Moritella yayanosii]
MGSNMTTALARNSKNAFLWTLIFKALWQRKQRVLVVIGALIVGAATVFALTSMYFDINAKMSHELRTYGANFFVRSAAINQHDGLDIALFDRVLALADDDLIVGASPYLFGRVRTSLREVVLVGTHFSVLPKISPYWQVEGAWVSVDFDERNAMIGSRLAKQLDVVTGSTVTIVHDQKNINLRIKGVIESGDASDNYLFVNLSLAQKLLNKPDKFQHILMSLVNESTRVEAFAGRINRELPQLSASAIRKISASEGQVLDKIKGLMAFIALMIFALTTLCVNTTLTAMIAERSREFALQKSLGARTREIIMQITIETLLITSIAVVLGCVLGYVLAQVLGQTVFSSSISFRFSACMVTVVASLVSALIAAIIPAKKATNVQVAILLKGE